MCVGTRLSRRELLPFLYSPAHAEITGSTAEQAARGPRQCDDRPRPAFCLAQGANGRLTHMRRTYERIGPRFAHKVGFTNSNAATAHQTEESPAQDHTAGCSHRSSCTCCCAPRVR